MLLDSIGKCMLTRFGTRLFNKPLSRYCMARTSLHGGIALYNELHNMIPDDTVIVCPFVQLLLCARLHKAKNDNRGMHACMHS
jgi:hypothetical protein